MHIQHIDSVSAVAPEHVLLDLDTHRRGVAGPLNQDSTE